ncbi:MAG: DNA repair protein RecO C-terminal domain-containing protein, partial [Armatimonadota bacterium]
GSGGHVMISGMALGALRGLLTLPPERLGRLALTPEVRRQVSQVVRSHVDYHVGEQLKTLKFLDKVRR